MPAFIKQPSSCRTVSEQYQNSIKRHRKPTLKPGQTREATRKPNGTHALWDKRGGHQQTSRAHRYSRAKEKRFGCVTFAASPLPPPKLYPLPARNRPILGEFSWMSGLHPRKAASPRPGSPALPSSSANGPSLCTGRRVWCPIRRRAA
jgi:hypothetical protein